MAKMKWSAPVIQQHIVLVDSKYQILFVCEQDKYFITTNGGFGQRDMYIEHIHPDEALTLIKPKDK